ncbi:HNH endonuclease [Bacillus thuringiensis]
MKNLNPIEENLIDIYKSIAEKSQGTKKISLLGEVNTINERYELYSENRRNLSAIEQIDYSENMDVKNHLLSCYGKNVTLNNLKVDITKKQELYYQAKCPYCGLNSQGSFDHYLPKEDYPDFAVLALNLIPCCEKCNSIKGERWKANNGDRLFINYYYDFIPQDKYLFAEISFNKPSIAPTVSYKIVNNEKIDSLTFKIIESHYNKLNLCSRFESHANDEISNFFNETKLAAQEGVDKETQKRTLIRKIKTNTDRAGRNNWLVSLYEAILESSDFFNHCYNEELTHR